MTYNQKALRQYTSVDVRTAVENASPHQLVSMLFDGALKALARARGLMEQRDWEGKGKQINKFTDIIINLKGCLDLEKGGEVAENLDRLYDYMLRRALEAHRDNQVEILDELARLVREIKSGWDEMPEEARNQKPV